MQKAIIKIVVVVILACFLALGACYSGERSPMSGSAPAKSAINSESGEMAELEADKITEIDGEGREGLTKGENPALLGRKLIREGQLSIQVANIKKTRIRIEKILREAGGFISNVDFTRQTYRHQITLQVRIPAKGFADFVKTASKLGAVENEQMNVIDITDKYVDMKRRIATQEKLAARLEKLIENSKYAFKDLLEVERELSRIQLEIERLKGMQRGYDDRVALSTLELTLIQETDGGKSVVPPTSVFSPMVKAIENAGPRFKRSFKGLLSFFAGLINLVIVLIPWLVVIIPMVLIFRWLIKKFIRLISGQPKPKQ